MPLLSLCDPPLKQCMGEAMLSILQQQVPESSKMGSSPHQQITAGKNLPCLLSAYKYLPLWSVMQFGKAMLMAFSGESGIPVLQSSEERQRAEPSRITIHVSLANNIFPGLYLFAYVHICSLLFTCLQSCMCTLYSLLPPRREKSTPVSNDAICSAAFLLFPHSLT